MKQTIRWLLASVFACAIGSLVTYRIAYHRGYESGFKSGAILDIHMQSFAHSLVSLGALQQLRGGDIPGVTRLVEKMCFGSAQLFYKEPPLDPAKVSDWGRFNGMDRPPLPEVLRELTQGLLKYRAAYRTNSADWDEMERKLEVQLAKLK
jgi:hypothetical protein